MLLTKTIKIKIYNSNIRFYKEKYNCKSGDVVKVNIKDIPKNSHVMVNYSCDYCGKRQNPIRYCDYNHQNKDRITNKDCCEFCKIHKIQESNIFKYKTKNVMGVEEIYNKQKNSCLNSIGVLHPYQNKEILTKALKKAKITMYKNNTAPCSKQQRYLHFLLGGELNYPINTLNLDIAFPNEMIYIEYDGGGHDLQVKFGNITYNKQKTTQRKREYLLHSKGWKLIRIVSNKDYLPLQNDIIKLINKSKKYLNSGHSWCEINIDKHILYGTDIKYKYDCIPLQLIHKEVLNKININN